MISTNRFKQVVETGYAPDGGLFVPATFPSLSKDELQLLYSEYLAGKLSY